MPRTIGQLIDEGLHRAGYKAKDLAARAGCTDSTISKIRSGKASSTPETVAAIARALGGNILEFLEAAGLGDSQLAALHRTTPRVSEEPDLDAEFDRISAKIGMRVQANQPFAHWNETAKKLWLGYMQAIERNYELLADQAGQKHPAKDGQAS